MTVPEFGLRDLPVKPYAFRGGNPADDGARIGPSGAYNTLHRRSGQSVQSVVPNADASRVAEALQQDVGR